MTGVDIRYAVGTPRGNGPLFTLCPFHDDTKPSMAVYPDGTYCFVCSKGESPAQFLQRIGFEGELPERGEIKRQPKFGGPSRKWDEPAIKLDQLKIRIDMYHRILTEGVRRERLTYLYERGLSRGTVVKQKLGHTGSHFVIPVWSYRYDRILGARLRADPEHTEPDAVKYLQPSGQQTLIYRPHLRGRPTVICEGELDALLLAEYGVDAVTSTGGAGTLAKYCGPDAIDSEQLIVATDRDEAGDHAYLALCARWERAIPRLAWGAENDIGDALLARPPLERGAALTRWLSGALPEAQLDGAEWTLSALSPPASRSG